MASGDARRLGALALAVVGLTVSISAPAVLSGTAGGAQVAAKGRPNIVVVVTDDQTLASLSATTMPNVSNLVGSGPTEFTNAVATTPLCCPSRATLLTGQYAHNHGALGNNPGYEAMRQKANTLPVWLRRAGYVTAHVGEYLNGYRRSVKRAGEVAPGWDEWHTAIDPGHLYYGYRMAVNGEIHREGNKPRDYITRVINGDAERMVRRYVPRQTPLYLQVDHRAPHAEAGDSGGPCGGLIPPDPRDATAFAGEELPRPPSFDEDDVSDKPSFIRSEPRLSTTTTTTIEQRYRCALASLRSVDRGVRRLLSELRRAKELDETVVVFTSDNGFFFGEHRIPDQKAKPYEEGLRIPLLIRIPGRYRAGPAVPTVTQPVSNVDLAPTILNLAGAQPCRSAGRCRVLDGRSLTGLIRGDASWPVDRAIAIELDDGPRARRAKVCRYQGVRVADQVYVRHTAAADPTGTCRPIDEGEHYDLTADPFQLDNLYPADPRTPEGAMEQELQARLEELQHCAGIAGRDPLEEGRSHCE